MLPHAPSSAVLLKKHLPTLDPNDSVYWWLHVLFVVCLSPYFIADSFLVDASSLIQNAANRMITMEITESFRRDDIVIDTHVASDTKAE